MIITLTPNPSTDVTLALPATLSRGNVQRLQSYSAVAGGKGVNVSHAIAKAGLETRAIFPAGANDNFLALLAACQIPACPITVSGNVRINTAVTEPDGTTTKLNGPGPQLSPAELDALAEKLISTAQQTAASWAVLAGSLPPGTPTNWYATLTKQLHEQVPGIKVAVDTSDAPLQALGKELGTAKPDLIKPNSEELGQLIGADGLAWEAQAEAGDYEPVITAAKQAVQLGAAQVLVTLGAAGAVLANSDGVWLAQPAPITPVSTVGAGDCTLAGFVMASGEGKEIETALATAVAYGSAAASLPGTTIPVPAQLNIAGAKISAL